MAFDLPVSFGGHAKVRCSIPKILTVNDVGMFEGIVCWLGREWTAGGTHRRVGCGQVRMPDQALAIMDGYPHDLHLEL